jgi:predicted ferric reductase
MLKIGPTPPGRGFWREFSVALGFSGLAMVMLQFILTARFRRIQAPYGSDIVYYFHRQISQVASGLILAHPLILFVVNPDNLRLLNPIEAPGRARAGVTALGMLILLVGLSIYRKRIKLEYDLWRITHGLFSVVAVLLAMLHVIGVGYYVNTPLKQILWGCYTVFWIGLLVYVRIIKPWIEHRRPYRVVEVIPERGDTWTVVIEPAGHPGIRFHPGQFAWISIRNSPFADREHPFSISSSAEHPERLSFSIKNLGDFTARIKEIQPGETAYLDGPYGAFNLDRFAAAPGFVFLAGGVGITPMMSMLRTMADRHDRRPVILIYGNNTWDNITFREEIVALQEVMSLKVVHVLTLPPTDWSGESGFISHDLLRRYLPDPREGYEHFICGPDPMMDSVEASLRQWGVPWNKFHSERFNLV